MTPFSKSRRPANRLACTSTPGYRPPTEVDLKSDKPGAVVPIRIILSFKLSKGALYTSLKEISRKLCLGPR